MPEPSRQYPTRPVVGVGAVVLTGEGRVVLVRRGQPPLAGEWSLPGGVLELGEGMTAGIRREVREETGLEVEVGPVVDVFEHISRDDEGRVLYHYVIVDYLCRARPGTACASSDVTELAEVLPAELGAYALRDTAVEMIDRALRLARP